MRRSKFRTVLHRAYIKIFDQSPHRFSYKALSQLPRKLRER